MKFWSVDELAEYLEVPRTWIYERTRQKGPEIIPHLKFGKYVRFNPESSDFQQWLVDHQVGTVVGSDTQQDFQTIESKSAK